MSPIRLVTRWSLTLVALPLALVAVLLLVLRLLLGETDRLLPALEAGVAARFGAEVSIGRLDGQLAGLDPQVSIEDIALRARGEAGDVPLLEIDGGELRLDTRASLGVGVPIVDRARFQGVTLHLYQDGEGRWRWPPPARIPPELLPETEFDLRRLDFWVGVLLRQRAWVDDLRLVLHGLQRTSVVHAPRLLMTGVAESTHIEGEAYVEGRPDEAMTVVMTLAPGHPGGDGFSAALQASMHLGSLTGLAELLGVDRVVRLDEASGEARLWGRWDAGRLADVRLDVQAPRLALDRSPGRGVGEGDEAAVGVVLNEAELRGQWRRRGAEAWEAWLEGDVASVEWRGVAGEAPPEGDPIPRYWHLGSRPNGWWANASGFELAALAQWNERLRLPEGLLRTVEALRPRGQVTGLGFGRLDGEWQAQVAATEVVVSPWSQAPGGGPLDIWLESRGLGGRVSFVDSGGAELYFPTLFSAPMALTRASGAVDWVYDGPRSFVSGRGLSVEWNGAEVEGDFGLSIGGPSRGGFGLQLDFRDVDALGRPLTDWLPMPLLREEVNAGLADWLSGGLAGRVPQGALRLHVPVRALGAADVTDTTTRVAPALRLDLEIVDGRLPYAPGWPALEDVSGRLRLVDETLSAEVDHAESLGVEARDAEVALADEELEVRGDLAAPAPALARYLAALPVEGMAAVGDWQGEGRVDGTLALSLPLADPESLSLDIETHADLARLIHEPTGLAFQDLQGPVAWHQQAGQGGLAGRLEGRLLGGPLIADIDTGAGGVDLSGTAEATDLLALGAPPGSEAIVGGRLPWRGRLRLGEGAASLHLESALEGLAIALPAPLGKAAYEAVPLRLDIELGDETWLSGTYGRRLGLRWREVAGGQGQLWLGRGTPVSWPDAPGWTLQAYLPRLVPADWSRALAPLRLDGRGGAGDSGVARWHLETDCLSVESHCLGRLGVAGRPIPGGWNLALEGGLVEGRVDYRPGLDLPLDIALDSLSLDGLLPSAGGGSGRLFDEIEVAPEPAALPAWLGELPAGRLRIADLLWQSRRFGPFNAHWRATPRSLTVDPVGLTLGEVSAHGNLVWEATGPGGSLTRARLSLDGRDIGSALEVLGQPVAVRSEDTRASSQLAWPGAPWQFALARSRGSLEVALRDGRFANIESPSARVIGLLNVDNLLRRLRLDFSDVTGRGTAFDRVTGAATLYGGVLETRGPVEIEGPATRFTLDGSVDLVRRELDQRLGVTVPVSNNLPLAAVIAGAPMVGGALFIADKLFGDVIDRVTRIHYRVRGPWTSPRIALESAE